MASSNDNTLLYVVAAGAAAWYFRDKIAAALKPATVVVKDQVGTPAPPAVSAPPVSSTPSANLVTDSDGCVWDPTHPQLYLDCKQAVARAKAAAAPPPVITTPANVVEACLAANNYPGTQWQTVAATTELFKRCGAQVSLSGLRGIVWVPPQGRRRR